METATATPPIIKSTVVYISSQFCCHIIAQATLLATTYMYVPTPTFQ